MPRNLDIEQLTIDRSVENKNTFTSSLKGKFILSALLLSFIFTGGAFVLQAANQSEGKVSNNSLANSNLAQNTKTLASS